MQVDKSIEYCTNPTRNHQQFEPTYNLGQTLYFLSDQKIVERRIIEIQMKFSLEPNYQSEGAHKYRTQLTYEYLIGDGAGGNKFLLHTTQCKYANSKQNLIEML